MISKRTEFLIQGNISQNLVKARTEIKFKQAGVSSLLMQYFCSSYQTITDMIELVGISRVIFTATNSIKCLTKVNDYYLLLIFYNDVEDGKVNYVCSNNQ